MRFLGHLGGDRHRVKVLSLGCPVMGCRTICVAQLEPELLAVFLNDVASDCQVFGGLV